MKIDFSIMQPFMNELAMHIVVVLMLPFVAIMIVVEILKLFKVPKFIGDTGASLLFLYLVYQMFLIRF